jgi:hypothetical protein
VIPASSRALVVGLVLTSIFYFAASLVFPDDPDANRDFDAYFFRHKKQILGAVLVADTIDGFLTKTLRDRHFSSEDLTSSLIVVAILSVAIFVKGRRANVIVLSIIVAAGMLTVFR